MGNHDVVFDEQKRLLRERRGIALGFGGVVMVMTSIPIINFFTMPLAVAGATLLWVEQFQSTSAKT
jgi:CysZ protein